MKVKNWDFEEEEAVHRIPYRGKCPERENAPHRLGLFPVKTLLDGGCPGDVIEGICIHCGKRFPRTRAFVVKNQPRVVGSHRTSMPEGK